MGKRKLTDNEISALQANSCWAEDWQRIEVSDDFKPNFFHRVMFYGDISLGAFNNNVEVSRGFMKHSGVNNATLRNVTIGDNCLIENVSGFINNYVIGNDCIISNVCTMETTDGATYGEGNLISVLNEVGEGNLILYHGLTSQVAALMVKHFHNRALKDAIRRLIREEIERTSPEMATIGNRVKIVNTKEITNTVIYDDCEISGASRLSDCTIMSNSNASVYIGTGVICENCSLSILAIHLDLTIMKIYYLLYISQAQTEALHIVDITCMNTVELIKNLLQILFLHTQARICDGEI